MSSDLVYGLTPGIDPRIVKARGLTADFMSVHVVTRGGGEHERVASFKGGDYPRALARMARFYRETGRHAWLVRGTAAAFLPLVETEAST